MRISNHLTVQCQKETLKLTPRIFVPICILIFLLNIPTAFSQNLLNQPQKIIIDAQRNRLIVSNYGSTGPLVQIDENGEQEYFVKNADCVDGMDIVGDVVYGVGRQRVLHAYDLETGQSVLEFVFPGNAQDYLSSVTSDEQGHLFISCPRLHTIYKFDIEDVSYIVFAQENGLQKPNGILLEKETNRLVVIDDSNPPSMIHAISLSDGTVSDLMTTDFRNPDGIVRDVAGTYYVGGYYLPGLYRIDVNFSQEPELFFEGNHMVYPTYDESNHSLLITYYGDNDWGRVMLPAGVLSASVTVAADEDPQKAEIRIGGMVIHPDSSGQVSRRVPVGVYDVEISLTGYRTVIMEGVAFVENQETVLTVELRCRGPEVDTERGIMSHIS